MGKDFDNDPETKRGARLALDRDFTLGGETFRLRNGLRVGHDVLDRWRDVLKRMLTPDEERGEGFKTVEDDEFVECFRETMLAILEPGQETAFDRVLSNDSAPIMIPDAFEVCFWAVGVVTGRPTDASLPFTNGSTTPTPEPVVPSSMVASSSPADEESEG